MKRHTTFHCENDILVGTLDSGDRPTGLFIVSGGNEIRSGAHGGQADMAERIAEMGYPVFRYDRRGIGDSEGENSEFENSGDDITAAVKAFKKAAPDIDRIVAFGNCDAAAALALFHSDQPIDALVLANPWVIENSDSGETDNDVQRALSAAAIRARYWARIKNPRSLIDLFTGKINLRKLAGGLAKATKTEAIGGLAQRLAGVLASTDKPVSILLASRDTTALAFSAAWQDDIFLNVRTKDNISVAKLDSASHSFADAVATDWLHAHICDMLK